jgi:hypothetical protein
VGFRVLVGAAAIACASCGSSPSTPGGVLLPFPIVPSYDGALLSPLNLVTIVSQSDSGNAPVLFAYSNGIGASQWWAALAGEYGLGPVTAAANLLGPSIDGDVTDHDVYEYITSAVAANAGPARDGNSLYLLYLPPGIRVIQGGVVNDGCGKFQAYHAPYGNRGDNLAVVQRCGGSDPFDNMMVSASHELIEAATDPDGLSYALPRIAPHAPWNEPIWNAYNLTGHAELADLCEGTYWGEGSVYYQRVWSNAAAAAHGDPCVPAIGQPYYDALFEKDWYEIAPGQTLRIPMVGWSSGSLASAWPVAARVASAVSGFSVDVGGDGTLGVNQISDVTVTAPSTAPSGTFAVVGVASQRPPNPPLSDAAHINYVGVYVP